MLQVFSTEKREKVPFTPRRAGQDEFLDGLRPLDLHRVSDIFRYQGPGR